LSDFEIAASAASKAVTEKNFEGEVAKLDGLERVMDEKFPVGANEAGRR